MNIHPRPALFLLGCGLALAGALTGLLVPAPVRADVGVQPVLPGGSSIKPDEQTPIQMAAEVVTMNIRAATEADNALIQLAPDAYALQYYTVWYPGVAEVEADFRMKNPTNEGVSMTVWFPLASALENVDWDFVPGGIVPHILNFQVNVDGNPLEFTISELPNPKGADKPLLPWASFPVTFPGEKETLIHVSYTLPLQPSVTEYEMALYYIFQTGGSWDGPIGQAELILNLPYPASEGTLAGILPGHLYLPPMFVPRKLADLPAGAVLEGNQARWTWKNFEPGPQDDFAIWLLSPGKWQELEAARAAVQAKPEDGMAWLDLASTYYWLVAVTDYPSIFGASYEQSCLEAYQKAAELIPEHPAPHAGLGLLALLPYLRDKNAPPEVMLFVLDELKTAKELEAKNPSWGDNAEKSRWLLLWLESDLDIYNLNEATITAQFNFISTEMARQTEAAALLASSTATPSATRTPTATLIPTKTPTPSVTRTPAATLTPADVLTLTAVPIPTTPPPTNPTTRAEKKVSGPSIGIILAAMGVILAAGGYLAWKRRRKSNL